MLNHEIPPAFRNGVHLLFVLSVNHHTPYVILLAYHAIACRGRSLPRVRRRWVNVAVVVVLHSHIQRVILATEETMVTQQVKSAIDLSNANPATCGHKEVPSKVNGSHRGDNPLLLRPTGIQIATKSYTALQAMAPTNVKTVHQNSLQYSISRAQPRSTRIVVAYPRPAFSATKRTNYAPNRANVIPKKVVPVTGAAFSGMTHGPIFVRLSFPTPTIGTSSKEYWTNTL